MKILWHLIFKTVRLKIRSIDVISTQLSQPVFIFIKCQLLNYCQEVNCSVRGRVFILKIYVDNMSFLLKIHFFQHRIFCFPFCKILMLWRLCVLSATTTMKIESLSVFIVSNTSTPKFQFRKIYNLRKLNMKILILWWFKGFCG